MLAKSCSQQVGEVDISSIAASNNSASAGDEETQTGPTNFFAIGSDSLALMTKFDLAAHTMDFHFQLLGRSSQPTQTQRHFRERSRLRRLQECQ